MTKILGSYIPQKGVTYIESRGRIFIDPSSGANSGTIFDARGADITIGKNVGIGYNCFFVTSYGSHYLEEVAMRRKLPIVVEDNAWIGFGAMIRGGVTIGRCSVVGMGAVVIKSVEPYHVAVGNPARDVGLRPDYTGFKRSELEGTLPKVARDNI